MLDVPVQRTGAEKITAEPPCFRCLFEKPICDGWCDPTTCEMLGAWLKDEDFLWEKYFFGWFMRLEHENSIKNGLTEIL